MRPLALAAIFVALAGCSLPYKDTTFKATVPFKHAMGEGEGGAETTREGAAPAETDKTMAPPTEGRIPTSPAPDQVTLGNTPAVFPNDAQPSGVTPDHVRPGGE